jgi:hypothetical protein
MLHDCKQETVNVIQLGRLKTSEVNQVLFLANQIQKTFIFDFKSDKNLILNDSFKLPNGGFDLCKAIKKNIRKNRYNALSKPIIFLTEEPFGSPEHATEPGWFFFSSQENDYDKKISIISTQPLEALPKQRTLQSYLFMMFATFILTTYGELAFHSDLRGCPLDFCDELKDAENCLRYGRICEECERILQTKLRQKLISLEKIGAAIRLLNRSVSRKYCFVLMPFNDKFRLCTEFT